MAPLSQVERLLVGHVERSEELDLVATNRWTVSRSIGRALKVWSAG